MADKEYDWMFLLAPHLDLVFQALSKIFCCIDCSGGIEVRSLLWVARLGVANPNQLSDLVGVRNKTWYNKLMLGDEKTSHIGFFEKLEKAGILTIFKKGGPRKEESWISFSSSSLVLRSIFYNLSLQPAFKPKCNEYRLQEIKKTVKDYQFLLCH